MQKWVEHGRTSAKHEKKFPHTNYFLIYHPHPLLITVNKFPHGYYFHMYTTVKLSKVKLYLHGVAHSALRLVSVGALYLKKYSMISYEKNNRRSVKRGKTKTYLF